MRRLSFIALMFFCAVGYAQFPMVGSGRQVYRPDQVDSLFYWFDAQDLATITTTNNKVTAWADKGPFGFDVVQADTSKAPTYSATSGPGGSTAAMTFDGTDDFLASAAHFWGSDDITVLVVMKFANDSLDQGEMVICRFNSTISARQWQVAGLNAADNYPFRFLASKDGGTNSILADYYPKHETYKIYDIAHNGSTTTTLNVTGKTYELTKTIQGTGDGTIYNFSQPVSVGALNTAATPLSFLNGSISEIIVYSRALTNAERQGIEAYLSRKYNLPLENKQKPPVISNRRIQPDYVDSLFYWFDAMDASSLLDSVGGAVANNEGVATWADKSGRNWDVTQGTNTARPVYKATGGPGGNTPAVQFDGTNDFLASAAHWWGSDDLSVFVVMKFGNATRDAGEVIIDREQSATEGQFDFYGMPASSNYRGYLRVFQVLDRTQTFGTQSPDNFKHTNYKTHCWASDGIGSVSLFSDGASISTTTAVSTGDGSIADYSQPLSIGALNISTTPALFLLGSISEIIVYSRALSDSERIGVEQYLKQKWGL